MSVIVDEPKVKNCHFYLFRCFYFGQEIETIRHIASIHILAYFNYLNSRIGKINIVPQDVGRVILNLLTNAFYAVSEKKKSNIEGYEPVVSISTKR